MSVILGCVCHTSANNSADLVSAMLGRIADKEHVTETLSVGPVTLAAVHRKNSADSGVMGVLQSADGNFTMTYRGAVANHNELRSINSGYPYRTAHEAESVLATYSTAGIGSILRHNGPATFAVYNNHAGVVQLIRDRYGQMSLFYTACKDFFAFSTDIAALLSLVRPQFNPDALSYQAFEFTVGEETVFRNIFSVNPGEYIEISPDLQYEKKQYWTVWDNFVEAPSNAGDAIEQMEWLLEDAMRLRVRGVNATVLASGGIDSSLSAALLKPSVIHHVHYDFTDFNELEYARCLADHIGAELRLIAPTKEEYLRDKDAILRVVGMPTTWTSFTLWAAIIGMKADGFTVFFTGDGADELLAGYHRYHLLIHDEQIKELEAMQGYSYLIKRYYGSRVERYARLINRCEDERDERVRAYLETTLTRFSEHCRNDIVTFMTLTDFYTTSQALFFLTDRLCAHFSVNSFSPFMDYRMVQFAFSLDSKLKIHEGTTKWILKKIAARRLPAKIVERKDKRGFSAPINHWFGWDKPGQYNRTRYKQHVFADWLRVFAVEQK